MRKKTALALALLLLCAIVVLAASPAFRAATTAGNSNGTALTLTKPTGTASDDILIAFIAWEDDVEPSAPAGWTLKSSVSESTTFSGYLWWKRAGGSEPADYTFTKGSPARWRTGLILAYSGGITSGDPFDVFSSNSEASGIDDQIECLTITTTVADTMIVALAGDKDNNEGYTPPSGMTERVDASTPVSAADVTQASAGATGEKVFTGDSSNAAHVSFLLAIKPPSGAPAPRRRRIIQSQ